MTIIEDKSKRQPSLEDIGGIKPQELLRKGGLAAYDLSYDIPPVDPVQQVWAGHQVVLDTAKIIKITHDEPRWIWDQHYPDYYVALSTSSNNLSEALLWHEGVSIHNSDLQRQGKSSTTIFRSVDQRHDFRSPSIEFDEKYAELFKQAIAHDDQPEDTIHNLEAANLFQFGPFPNLMRDPKFRNPEKAGWMIQSADTFALDIAAWMPKNVFFSTWYGKQVHDLRIDSENFLQEAFAKLE